MIFNSVTVNEICYQFMQLNLFSGHIPRGLPRTLPAKQE